MRRYWLPSLCVLLSLVFANLGVWQLKRLEWKNGLIDRIERNTVMEALVLQNAAALASLEPDADEYRRVRLQGKPDCGRSTPVWAATQLGTGYWWMVPLQLEDGSWLWVNRGYVTPDAVAAWRAGQTFACGPVLLEGLLRKSQPGGGFLRENDAGAGRWYSRDIEKMTLVTGLKNASSNWFVDEWPAADPAPLHSANGESVVRSTGESVARPAIGLTPLQFPNKHLGYALTWFALAVASIAAAVLALRSKV